MRNTKFNPLVDIIIPTYDNTAIVNRAIRSVMRFTTIPYRLIIVNNHEIPGEIKLENPEGNFDFVSMLNMKENKGWIGGINAGIRHLKQSEEGLSPYILFLNDDIQILDQQNDWLTNMIKIFEYYNDVGAVGPISNSVLKWQSLGYTSEMEYGPYHEVSVLSGFCFLTKKEVIEKIGELDETLFGGDDLDYSIRIKQAGYRLVCCRKTFVYHYYAQTGKRLHSDWDSQEWGDKIAADIIRKHGLREYYKCLLPIRSRWDIMARYDLEKTVMSNIVPNNGKKIYDVGCGINKLYDCAIGVDRLSEGEFGISGGQRTTAMPKGVVNIVADISQPLPIESEDADYIVARHVLEHIVDHVSALREWKRILKIGGKLVISVPDDNLMKAMACDPTHVHVFTPESLKTVLDLLEFKEITNHFVDGTWSNIITAVKA